MTTDVEAAMRQLEERDRKGAGRARKALTSSVDLARGKLDDMRERSAHAITLVERGGVHSVENGTALGRIVQEAAMEDALRALDCLAKITASRSLVEVYAAQFAYVRAQTEVNLGRWRMLAGLVGKSAGAAAGPFGEALRNPVR